MTFLEWIGRTPADDWKDLKAYIASNSVIFATVTTPENTRAVIDGDTSLDDTRKAVLVKATTEAWQEFQKVMPPDTTTPPLLKRGKWFAIMDNLPNVLLGLVLLLGISVLASVIIPNNTILDDLGDVEIARGLITFVFTFGVIFVSFVLLIALFSSDDPLIAAKFDKAKELFTAMIAIMGTILGFYFGQAGQSPEPGREPVAVSEDQSVLFGMSVLGIDQTDFTPTPEQLEQIKTILEDAKQNVVQKTAAINTIIAGDGSE